MKHVVVFVLLVCSVFAGAQSASTKLAPPIPPVLLTYRYWPDQFVQWLGEELPYSMIVAEVDATSPQPSFDIMLTERATQKQIHFTNQQTIADGLKAQGIEVHLTQIKFTPAETEGNGATYNFQFTGPKGKPVQWRFVQGSDLTERGSGLTDMSQTPNPLFLYRELGAVAGQGSAIQIGTKVSEAEVWKEISSPPYFIGYRGAHSTGVNIGILRPGTEEWKILEAPQSLSVGAKWQLGTADGRHKTIEVKQLSGSDYTLIIREERAPGQHLLVTGKHTGENWTLESLRAETDTKPEQHGFAIHFLNPLPLSNTAAAEIKYEIFAGKKTKVGNGTVAISATANSPANYQWQMKTPEWMQKKNLTDQVSYQADTIAVKAALK